MPVKPKMRCIVCGCTEERACFDGCSWLLIDPPVCTTIACTMAYLHAKWMYVSELLAKRSSRPVRETFRDVQALYEVFRGEYADTDQLPSPPRRRAIIAREKEWRRRYQASETRRKPRATLLLGLLCASVSLWLLLTAPSAHARPILALSTDAAAIVHRGDVFTATVYLVNAAGPPTPQIVGVDWSLAFPGVFHVLSRELSADDDGNPFTDPLTLDPTPGGADLGATLANVSAPAPPGCWTLAALRIQVDASAPFGTYDLTTLSPGGAGVVDTAFADHPFAFHTTWPLEIADSQILKSQILNSEIQAPEPASACVLLIVLLVIEFGLGPRRRV